ncbi:MAG: hypothetical protein HZA52_17405 [Planctomycetes bacterium]|nr:hypothetical protein [Planctomycetota bacterium]
MIASEVTAQSVPQAPGITLRTPPIVESGVPSSVGMRDAFSTVDLSSANSGILLDIGALFSKHIIESRDGLDISQDAGVGMDAFVDAFGDLARSEIVLGSKFPPIDSWSAVVLEWRQAQEVTPIAIAMVGYDRIDPAAYTDGRLVFDGVHFHESVPGTPFVEHKSFVAASILAPTLVGPTAQLVIPSNLLVGGIPATAFSNLQVQVAGQAPIAVAFDQPFTVTNLVPDTSGVVRIELHFDAAGGSYSAATAAKYSAKKEPSYGDKGLITASLPYLGGYGKMYVRLYPATGRSLPMQKPIVVIDGIDVMNNRSFDEIWNDFGDTLQKLLDLGYDLVVCDYENGRDYIQRNGFAVREVLARLPSWQAPGHQFEPAAILAGSMGTQTARYALTTAERDFEDHHIGLFVSVDGPYTGANIPIGLQGFVEFLAPEKQTVKDFLTGLDSPAASQLLRKNRFWVGWTKHVYEPRQEFIDYFAEANTLGLPKQCRNVAIASGSGDGTRVTTAGVVEYLRAKLIVTVQWWWWTIVSAGVDIKVDSDHQGQVFYGWMKKPGSDARLKIWSLGAGAEKLDLAPGGLRDTPKTIKDAWNSSLLFSLFVPMSSQLDTHCFIPTSSALGFVTSDLNYAPKYDAQLRQHSPFDAVHLGDPNTYHVSETAANIEFIADELERFFGVREEHLLGDLCADPTTGGGGTGTSGVGTVAGIGSGFTAMIASASTAYAELVSVNTELGRAMIQRRSGSSWQLAWTNNSTGFIGSWHISPGDRYYLADLTGDEYEELLCVSSSVPASAMIQKFDGTAWQFIWQTLDGTLGGTWTLRSTDRFTFGVVSSTFVTKDRLLAVYPYQTHSTARILSFTGASWISEWSNGDSDWIGGYPIQLGDRYSLADLDGSAPEELISVNAWTYPAGWVVVQRYDAGNQLWNWLSASTDKIGFGWVRGAGDQLEFADTDGDGRAELHCISGAPSPWAAVLDYTPGTTGDWTMKWDNGGDSMLGLYQLSAPYKVFTSDHLRPIDKFVWGRASDSLVDSVLVLAPHTQGPARLLGYQLSPAQWLSQWGGTITIGFWSLYQ